MTKILWNKYNLKDFIKYQLECKYVKHKTTSIQYKDTLIEILNLIAKILHPNSTLSQLDLDLVGIYLQIAADMQTKFVEKVYNINPYELDSLIDRYKTLKNTREKWVSGNTKLFEKLPYQRRLESVIRDISLNTTYDGIDNSVVHYNVDAQYNLYFMALARKWIVPKCYSYKPDGTYTDDMVYNILAYAATRVDEIDFTLEEYHFLANVLRRVDISSLPLIFKQKFGDGLERIKEDKLHNIKWGSVVKNVIESITRTNRHHNDMDSINIMGNYYRTLAYYTQGKFTMFYGYRNDKDPIILVKYEKGNISNQSAMIIDASPINPFKYLFSEDKVYSMNNAVEWYIKRIANKMD